MGIVWAMREVRVGCGCHGVHVDYLWVVCVLWRSCGLHVVAMVAMGCVWTTYGLCMCCEGGAGCMWWPWGVCGLPMGYVWAAYISIWLWCSWLLIYTNFWLVIAARYCTRFILPLDQFHFQHASFHKKNDSQIPKLKVSLLFHFQLTTIPLLLSIRFIVLFPFLQCMQAISIHKFNHNSWIIK